MTLLLDYWLKANLFLLLFYGCYALLLRRHTFLALNRAYLMGSVVLALLLPLVHIPGLRFPWPWETDTPVYAAVSVDAITVVGGTAAETNAFLLPDWPVLAMWIFGLVAAALLLRTGWRTAALLRFIRQWPSHPFADHTLVLPNNVQTPTFSFFRYLVLNPDDAQTEAVRQHELMHIRQKHSFDVLFLEVLQALCWPNPALIGYRRAIRQVHEYLADRDATPQTPTHRDAYARFLVSYAFHLPADSLAHSFGPDRPNSPTLKQRIQMLYQQHTRRRALWKYALVLPLATTLLAMTNVPESISAESQSTQVQELTSYIPDTTGAQLEGIVQDQSGKPLPDAAISVIGSQESTTTDVQGHFRIKTPANAKLLISFVGFNPQEIEVGSGQHVFRIQLAPKGENNSPRPITDVPASQTVPPGNLASPAGLNEVFTIVEENPTFPGGMSKLFQFIQDNIRYPEEARQKKIQGKVFVNFVVNMDGHIDRIRILKGISGGCDEEAVRMMSIMPKWIPGRQSGRPVAVQYNLPINFQLGETKKLGMNVPSSLLLQMDSLAQGEPSIYNTGILRNEPIQFGSKNPLVFLDGKEISQEGIKDIDPNTIQTINVLKNISATSIYGEKGLNGVILITTKVAKGKP